jgi:hypothetical protein
MRARLGRKRNLFLDERDLVSLAAKPSAISRRFYFYSTNGGRALYG